MALATAHRGTKRKRQINMSDDNPTAKLPGKLHHAFREVKKLAKKAKTFETQKIVKKLKVAKSSDGNESEIGNLESQLDILKHLDLDDFATVAFRNKLKKDHDLSSNLVVVRFLNEGLAVSKADIGATSLEGKLRNKLMSSKTFSLDMISLIDGLRRILRPNEVDGREDSEHDGEVEAEEQTQVGEGDQISGDEEGGASLSVDEDKHETADEDEADWESGSVSSKSWREDNADGQIRVVREEDSDLEDESSESEGSDVAINRSSRDSNKRASSSTFLPSLSVGFIRGNSDSDNFSDDEDKSDARAKKNRRGQRARRAIWEKKYGRGAKHLQKQMELGKPKQKSDRDNRGATTKVRHSRTLPPKFQPPTTRDSGYPSRTTVTSSEPPPAKRVRKDDKPLHPSWEAKKKLKESQKAVIVPAQGKKIVF